MNQEVPGRFALRVVWAGLMVVFAAYVAVALGLGGSGLLDAFSTWVYIALVLGAAALLALRAFTGEGERAPWLALAASAALWAAGELVYEIAYSEAPELAPYPSVADALWLGAYVAAGAGIVLVLRARLRRAFHPTMWLDAAIGATTIAALTAAIAFDPVLAETGGATLEVATDLAYPLADLGLLALVVTLLALTGWRPGLGWAAFAVALTAQAVSDVLYAREIALGTDGQDTLLAPVWPAATLLLAYAAWRPLSAPTRSGVPLARVFIFPAVFTSLALGDARLRPLPRDQHARRRARRDRDRAGGRRGWRCRSSTTCGCCGARARMRSPTRSRGCRTGARSWTTSRGRSRPAGRCSRADARRSTTSTASSATTTPTATRRATRCCSACRPSSPTSSRGHGQAYRLGGDEFCLLLEADGSDAVLRAAATRARGARRRLRRHRLLRPRRAARGRRRQRGGAAPRRPPHVRREGEPPVLGRAPDPQRAAQGALRARAGAARALDRRHGPRARRRAAARAAARRARGHRAGGGAARHRQDGDPRRDPQQARAAGRARVALHAPPHDHRRGHPQRGARAAARGGAGAGEPRALGREPATPTARRARTSPRARASWRSATPSARWSRSGPTSRA